MSTVLYSDSRRVLITGIDGFTGRYVSKCLVDRGFLVFGTSFKPQAVEKKNVFSVDLTDVEAITRVVFDVRPDYVVHLAAVSFVADGDVERIYQANLFGTRNLLHALERCQYRSRQILVASSGNVYGNAGVDIIDENVPVNPINDYSVSKVAMEYICHLWADRLPIVTVRPFNYTGLGQSEKFLIPKIVSHFRRGEQVIELGNLEIFRDFSDVRRVAEAYTDLLLSGVEEGVFNLCSGKTHSLMQVISIMEGIAGYKIKVSVNPEYVRDSDVQRLQGSCRKLNNAVGNLLEIPFEETLAWMYHGGKCLESAGS